VRLACGEIRYTEQGMKVIILHKVTCHSVTGAASVYIQSLH